MLVQLIAANMEFRIPTRVSRKEVVENSDEEFLSILVVQFELACRWLQRELGPRLFVRSGNQVRLGIANCSRVSRKTTLQEDFDPMCQPMALDIPEICRCPHLSWVVSPFANELRKNRKL